MIFLTELTAAFLVALVLENLLFTRAVDIPGIYQKLTPSQIILVGSVLTGIIYISSVPAFFLNSVFATHSAFEPMLTFSFLAINAVVFLAAYFALKRFAPNLFEKIKKELPFYGVNCATLAPLLIASRMSNNMQFFSFFGYCLGSGVGFTAAMFLMWSVRQKISLTRIPKVFRGLPITFIYLGIISLALFGLLGNQLPA